MFRLIAGKWWELSQKSNQGSTVTSQAEGKLRDKTRNRKQRVRHPVGQEWGSPAQPQRLWAEGQQEANAPATELP